MAAFFNCTQPLAEDKSKRLMNGAVVDISAETHDPMPLRPDEIYLANIEVAEQQRGTGTRTMRQLTQLADTFDITVWTHAIPMGVEGGPNKLELQSFYRQHGFEKASGRDLYVRSPKRDISPGH